jgi:hypothetical protein
MLAAVEERDLMAARQRRFDQVATEKDRAAEHETLHECLRNSATVIVVAL